MTATADRRRNLARFGAVVLLAWLAVLVVADGGFRAGVRSSDWPTLMTMGRIVEHDPARLYDRVAQRYYQEQILGPGGYLQAGQPAALLGTVAPPWVAILTIPFARLGVVWGGVAWTLAELACLLAGMVLLARRAWDGLLATAGFPTFVLLANANLDGIVVLGLGLAWCLRRRPVWAGVALGLTLVKPHLVLTVALALLAGRRFQVVAGWAAAALALVAADELVHPGLTLAWVQAATGQAGRIGVDLTPAGIGYQLAPAAGWAIAAAGAVAAILLARRRPPALVAGSLLGAAHGLISDLTLVAAGVAMARRSRPLELGLLSAASVALVFAGRVPLLEAALGTALLLGYTIALGRQREVGEPGGAPAQAG